MIKSFLTVQTRPVDLARVIVNAHVFNPRRKGACVEDELARAARRKIERNFARFVIPPAGS